MMMLLVLAAPAALAGSDHDAARNAYKAGRIMSLDQILTSIRPYVPGRLLDANLANAGSSQPIYVIRTLDDRGKVREVFVDAQTAKILRVRGR
jgi:uncharacterized membrane protein YkoI